MCSILGYYNYDKNIKIYNNLLRHRGPDNSTIEEYKFNGKKLYLAHNRLAIQDLDIKANQPMESKRFVLIVRHYEVRKELNFNN